MSFDTETRARLEAEAARRGISLSEFTRQAVVKELTNIRLGAGIITGSVPGESAADLTDGNKHIWLDGFGEF